MYSGVSTIRSCEIGTVQGSIHGPILYAIFVSPIFDMQDLIKFADDNFIIRSYKEVEGARRELQMALDVIIMAQGLSVNEKDRIKNI